MKKFRKIAAIICLLMGCNSLQGMAQEFQPNLQRIVMMKLAEKSTGDVHCVLSLKSLYIPIMDYHDGCLLYTGRFDVFRFNGTDFWYDDTDGAWWLYPDLRNYKRTISNRKTPEGIEQIDLMPDGTYRQAIWKDAETLDDLRKEPDEVKISKSVFRFGYK